MSIPGLQDKESLIMDPWSSLFKLLVLIGQSLGWDVEIEFFTKSRFVRKIPQDLNDQIEIVAINSWTKTLGQKVQI